MVKASLRGLSGTYTLSRAQLHSRMLRYLDEVARSGSIRRAAGRLNVASSSINRQILTLESEFGVSIFDRLPKRLVLTSFGELLIAHIRDTLREFARIEAQLDDLKGLRGGEVSIATMNGLASGLVPRVIAEFSGRFPRVRITSRVMFIRDIVRSVSEGEADLGLAYNLPQEHGLLVIDEFDARLGAVVAPGHKLAGHDSVRLSECTPHPIALADPTMLMRETMAGAFARARAAVEPTYVSNSIEFMKFLASVGECIAFLSTFDITEERRAGTLVHLPIRDRGLGRNRLYLVQRSNHSLGRASSLLAEDFRRALRSA